MSIDKLSSLSRTYYVQSNQVNPREPSCIVTSLGFRGAVKEFIKIWKPSIKYMNLRVLTVEVKKGDKKKYFDVELGARFGVRNIRKTTSDEFYRIWYYVDNDRREIGRAKAKDMDDVIEYVKSPSSVTQSLGKVTS